MQIKAEADDNPTWLDGTYPFPHLGLGLSERNMGRNLMKSLPCGLCLPSGVRGLQRMQEGSATGRKTELGANC
jgi:hypothetical protein